MSEPTKKVSRQAQKKIPIPSDGSGTAAATVAVFQGPPVRLDVNQAAARAGNSTRTIKRWIKAGYLPATRQPSPKGMGHLRVRLGDLESIIAAGAVS
jgi:hypothetical protein